MPKRTIEYGPDEVASIIAKHVIAEIDNASAYADDVEMLADGGAQVSFSLASSPVRLGSGLTQPDTESHTASGDNTAFEAALAAARATKRSYEANPCDETRKAHEAARSALIEAC